MNIQSTAESYQGRNTRETCICGATRTDIENRIWYVGEYGSLVWAPYYYRCPACQSFSAVNLRFAPESYEETPIDSYCIPDAKRELNRARVQWILDRGNVPQDALIYDLGAGEGAFTQAFTNALPDAKVVAVEADYRMVEKFHLEYENATVVEDYIEPFLARSELTNSADVIVLTDVLEHVIDPTALLSLIVNALKPGGLAYITVPNSGSLFHHDHVPASNVPWARANVTYQHLWVISPHEMVNLLLTSGEIVEYTRSLETDIRLDAKYSTFLLRK